MLHAMLSEGMNEMKLTICTKYFFVSCLKTAKAHVIKSELKLVQYQINKMRNKIKKANQKKQIQCYNVIP